MCTAFSRAPVDGHQGLGLWEPSLRMTPAVPATWHARSGSVPPLLSRDQSVCLVEAMSLLRPGHERPQLLPWACLHSLALCVPWVPGSLSSGQAGGHLVSSPIRDLCGEELRAKGPDGITGQQPGDRLVSEPTTHCAPVSNY